MDFSNALTYLQNGYSLIRDSWTEGAIEIVGESDNRRLVMVELLNSYDYVPTTEDLLATDWRPLPVPNTSPSRTGVLSPQSSFQVALRSLKIGARVRRQGWNYQITLQEGEFFIEYDSPDRLDRNMPSVLSQFMIGDLLAQDWEILVLRPASQRTTTSMDSEPIPHFLPPTERYIPTFRATPPPTGPNYYALFFGRSVPYRSSRNPSVHRFRPALLPRPAH